jgi:hypothetical protein
MVDRMRHQIPSYLCQFDTNYIVFRNIKIVKRKNSEKNKSERKIKNLMKYLGINSFVEMESQNKLGN